jgi:hypothetical protein
MFQHSTKIFGPGLEELLNSAGFYRKREWVGLHGSEVPDTYKYDVMFMEGWLWAEERLKEKNHG